MKTSSSALISLAALIAHVSGHGFITSPPPRQPGQAMAAACGQQAYYNQASDLGDNIQRLTQIARSQPDYNAAECNLWLCKGYQFSDNAANVQTFTPGQTVPIIAHIHAPHTGTANVSIVSTRSNTVIGQALKSFPVYASNQVGVPDSQKKFDIVIPSDIGNQCVIPGDCVIQWFWDARSIDETYESCIDFTVAQPEDADPLADLLSPELVPAELLNFVLPSGIAVPTTLKKLPTDTTFRGQQAPSP